MSDFELVFTCPSCGMSPRPCSCGERCCPCYHSDDEEARP